VHRASCAEALPIWQSNVSSAGTPGSNPRFDDVAVDVVVVAVVVAVHCLMVVLADRSLKVVMAVAVASSHQRLQLSCPCFTNLMKNFKK
jgi:hypothetical protein